MCNIKRWDGEPMRHVHCTARLASGRRCGKIAMTDPCGLCVLQGRAGPEDDGPRQELEQEDF